MRTFPPAPEDFDATRYAKEAAHAVGLPLPDEDVAEVALNLERTAGFAQLLAEIPGIDEGEPAPVFRPQGEGT